MRLLHRASPWRGLFAGETLPDPATFPPLLAPLRDALVCLGPDPSLKSSKAWQYELCRALQRLDLPGWRISQVLSDHDDWLYRQSIRHSLDTLRSDGWGEPPVAYCVLTMGSLARHESLLSPDQDNGMIVADYPDDAHDTIDGYFQALGERFTDALAQAGIPLCGGQVMARWPMWRKRLSEWREQFRIWTAGRIVKRVQQANILLDFAPVYGEAALADALRDTVVETLPPCTLFLDEMTALLDEVPVALDRFGRLSPDGREAPHDAALNLKRQGILPLQNAARLLAIMYGVRHVDTRSRLQALLAADVLRPALAQNAGEALDHCQTLLLDAQLTSLEAGRRADDWVDLRQLSDTDRLRLRHSLQQVSRLVDVARRAKPALRC